MIKQNQIFFNKEVNFKQITFPIIFIDFEAYHLLKNSFNIDYFPQINAKPFLLGYAIVKNYNDLLKIINTNSVPYENFFNWEINNEQGNTWLKFVNFFNKLVNQYNLKSLIVMGKLLEQTIFQHFFDLNLLNEKSIKLEMYDIYDFYNSNFQGEQINFNQIQTTINFYNINSFITDNDLYDKKKWNIIWKELDKIYSFKGEKELKEFKKKYLSQIVLKNQYDLAKLIILFYQKYIS